ncbi:MAG: alkaline phosphatase [Bacteroidia bacterium]|nr:alkaline phosphatase [Bacteroidia bacterium]
MRHWQKTSLFTIAFLIALFIGLIYAFNLSVKVTPLKNIEFSPGEQKAMAEQEYDSIKPKNIIIFIADGMGFSHMSLAMMTQQLEGKSSVWDEFEVRGWHNTRSIYGPLTDSEASATAMATGNSTNFGHIGMDKDGNTLENIFEIASANNYTTGIVTDSYIWDGSPAAFVAHSRNEDDARDILKQIAASDLDLIFGELEDLGEDDVPEKDESLEIIGKRFQLLDRSLELPKGNDASKPVAVLFDEDEIQDLSSTPNLPQLTETALNYLSNQESPFILFVECEEMDSASHSNASGRLIDGLAALQTTLELIMEFSKINGETLLVFTSDHETGGLAAVSEDDYPNLQISWGTKGHTAAVVPLLAYGPGARYFADVKRNYDIGRVLKNLISNQSFQSQ